MKAGVALMAMLAVTPAAVSGAEYKLLGTIRGEVRNPAGTGQMGAVVSLYNRYERLIDKALTDAAGRFQFRALAPDQYAVRVNLSTYVPANRTHIAVRAGMESYLSIELATIFSSIELVYTAPVTGSPLMTEDWKWVLRSSGVTRPVLRALPGLDVHFPGIPPRAKRSNFELTSGLMRVSAGSEGSSSVLGHEPDLGTAFALATSVFGGSELRVLGNLGYASSMGVPVTAFRTSYSGISSPDVELTVRQVSMRHAAGRRFLGGPGAGESPLLRTMSAKVIDQQQITGQVSLEYGALLEAVAFLDRMTVFSPFARLTTDLGGRGAIEMAYSSGAPPLDLLAPASMEGSLQGDMVGLAMFPRISLRGGHARVQRTESYEAGYKRLLGAWTVSTAAYAESVRDAAFTVAAPAGLYGSMDLLPDIASNSSIFNMGAYRSDGMMSAVSRALGQDWTAGILAGWSGMLAPNGLDPVSADPDSMRSRLSVTRRMWGAARVNGQLRESGTRLAATYVWTPEGVVPATHAWLTQRMGPQAGLNIQIRQPLPSSGFIPGRFEMIAEVRNLLAAGYTPIPAPDGRTIYLVQFPRSLRGGFSFIF